MFMANRNASAWQSLSTDTFCQSKAKEDAECLLTRKRRPWMERIKRTTRKGYLRTRKDRNGKLRMEHDLVWEEHFGAIPNGMQIHHIDGCKTNNDISNLMIVTPLEHKRIHSGCVRKDGVWYKKCKMCGEMKAVTEENWYFDKKTGWINPSICRPCYVKKVCADRREREKTGWVRADKRKRMELKSNGENERL